MTLQFLYETFGKNVFLLPERVEIDGSIEAAVPGQIDGYVKGDVRTTGKLVIGKKARIQGNVYAGDLVSYGRIDGDVFVNGKALLAGRARIKGDVTATVLDIREEAVVDGTIHKNIHSGTPDVPEDVELGGNAAEASAEPGVSASQAIDPAAPSGRRSADPAAPSAGRSSILEEEELATSWF